MQTLECIKTRRSIREYLDKDISDDIITNLIDAARYAPHGGKPTKDCQPWEFIIIKNQEIKKELALGYDDRQFVKEAPIVIAVCADKTKDSKYKNWDITSALAIQNMLLAINDLGLGACFVTTFNHHDGHKEDRQKLIETLNLPENIELIALIAIGYPDKTEKIEEKQLKEINEMLYYEKWK